MPAAADRPAAADPGRKITHDKGLALIAAMESALGAGDRQAAQCVACESVVIAELVDHTNWELIGEAAKSMTGADGKAMKQAHQEVEVLPPPEERKHVKTAIGAARAERARKTMR